MSKFELVLSAPNQNHEQFAHRLERLVPLLAARALADIRDLRADTPSLRVEAWNSYGHQMDVAYRQSPLRHDLSREEYATSNLQAKYTYLESIGLDSENVEVIRDDEPTTTTWMETKLTALANEGVIYEDFVDVNICHNCGNTVAAAGTTVSQCSRCLSEDIRPGTRSELVMDVARVTPAEVESIVTLPHKSAFLNGQFATMPPRVLIGRQRDYGLSLDVLGRNGQVLDPKLGLSLMPQMIAERHGLSGMTQIQGTTTAKNTVPYSRTFSPQFDLSYILTHRIPNNMSSERVEEMGIGFFTRYLPLYTLEKTGDVNEAQLLAIQREHAKTDRKYANVAAYLDSLAVRGGEDAPLDTTRIDKGIDDITQLHIRAGMAAVRGFIFEELSGGYAESLKIDGKKPDVRRLASVKMEASMIL